MNNVQTQFIPLAPPPHNGVALKLNERMEINNEINDADEHSDSSSTTTSESSDDGSEGSNTTTSSDSEGTQEQKTFEMAQITDEVLQLPRVLCEFKSVFNEFFTEELWSQLEPEQRAQLQRKLPDFSKLLDPAEAMAEQRHTVQLLFRNKLERFGRDPLLELQRNLVTGNYRPDIKTLRRSIFKSQRREQRFRECERVGRMAKRLFIARERFLRNVYNAAPDEVPSFEKSIQKQQNQNSFILNADTKISAVRARKRFYVEVADLKKEINMSKPYEMLSADEEDKDEDSLYHLTQEWHAEELAALRTAATMASSTDKCIYDTFFERRKNFADEDAMRLSQYAKRPKLNNRSFKQYLTDYKRKKLTEPNLPDYETADIRLRDVCARAQVIGSFKRSFPLGQKPGRKSKPKLNGPPALVPIQSGKQNLNASQQAANQTNDFLRQQRELQESLHTSIGSNVINDGIVHDGTFHMFDGEVEVQQEEVETSIPAFVVGNEIVKSVSMHGNTSNLMPTLPKLEPIMQRTANNNGQIKTKTPQKVNNMKTTMNTSVRKVQLTTPTIVTTSTTTTPTSSIIGVSELIQETHACFFALIRDFFCATPNHRMKFDELKQRIQIWLNNPITALNDWYAQANNWPALLLSAIKFLAGDYVEQPDDYVPYVDFKAQANIYQWIGAGRDSDSRLTTICNYWLQHRKELHLSKSAITPFQQQQQQQQQLLQQQQQLQQHQQHQNQQLRITNTIDTSRPASETVNIVTIASPVISGATTPTTPPPPPRFPTKWTVRAATTDEIIEFQRQERERFEQPHRAYTYRMYGYESVVGPVRGIYSQTLALTKARGHSMMVDDRPNFVTILTLVRDATARLPNGEGTRADISELLKCSQYINPIATENVMQTIVSGALDRLHTESDPCVRYDPKRKIWIYLHRNRSEAEFERMHQKQQGQPKLTKFTKTASIPPSMVDSPATGAILNSVRKVVPKSVVKTLPAKDGITLTMPALVPSNSTIVTQAQLQTQAQLLNKQQQQQQQQQALPKTALPVPPLKYNIPNVSAANTLQQQKSLLKPNVSTQQRRFIDPKTGATILTTNIIPQKQMQPLIVTTSSGGGGVQTLHVTNPSSPATTANATMPLTATVGGKRVSIGKPIIINQIAGKVQQQQQQQNRIKTTQMLATVKGNTQQQQQQQTTQGFIIPISAANSNMQMQLPQKLIQVNNISPLINTNTGTTTSNNMHKSPQTGNVQTIVVESPNTSLNSNDGTPKNIIRFLPNTKQHIVANNKIIGQRLITTATNANTNNNTGNANVTIRGTTKILTTTVNNANASASSPTSLSNQDTTTNLLANNSTIGNAATLPGTIIKMSPQAFNALQQKQQMQQLVKTGVTTTTTAAQQQQQQQQRQQQRLIIGNTAIIAHGNLNTNVTKNIVIQQQKQPSPIHLGNKVTAGGTIITQAKSIDATISTTSGNKIQMLNATSLTPQQQRILIQNLKQQQQQQQQSLTKPLSVVISQSSGGVTRLLKSSSITTSPTAGATQKPTSSTSTATMSKIIGTVPTTATTTGGQIITLNAKTTADNGTIITSSSNNQFTVTSAAQSPRNIITIGGTTQQRLITTQAAANKTINATTGNSNIRLIQSSGAGTTTNIGPTTFSIANIQGKQVVFATKNPANLKQVTSIGQTTKNASNGNNNIIIGGQTLKLQGNNLQALGKESGNIITTGANSQQQQQPQQLQTVIMGNQILRVLPQNLIGAKTVNKSDASNIVQNRIVTVSGGGVGVGGASGSSGSIIKANTSGTTITNALPKTLVLGSSIVGSNNSGTQTIRFQNAQQHTTTKSQQDSSQQTIIQKSNTGGVQIIQGGSQIILPSNFAVGGTLNLKSLQNMKLVTLAQVQQQQQQDKSKSNSTTVTTPAKT